MRLVLLCVFAAIHGLGFAQESSDAPLKAPANWGGETIKLPPGFARDMSLRGTEHIRFAPGMMDADSDTFFSYAFVFVLDDSKPLEKPTIESELLKYYRGLCKAVMGRNLGDTNPNEFALTLGPLANPIKGHSSYRGKLEWVEPFTTKKPQVLNLEVTIWKRGTLQYLFACVSPNDRKDPVWEQLTKIRQTYISDVTETSAKRSAQ